MIGVMVRAKKPSPATARPAAGTSSRGSIAQDEVARVAYELFLRRGGIHGNDQNDWFEAERIVRARQIRAPRRQESSRG